MFEARLTQGKILKQLIEALKDLVQEANIDCSDDEISIQAMDNSHVSLVAVALRAGGFDHFRCDRPISLGFNATNMGKILKCAGNDDIITLKAKDDGDALELVFESPGQDRIADFGEFPSSLSCHFSESLRCYEGNAEGESGKCLLNAPYCFCRWMCHVVGRRHWGLWVSRLGAPHPRPTVIAAGAPTSVKTSAVVPGSGDSSSAVPSSLRDLRSLFRRQAHNRFHDTCYDMSVVLALAVN